MRVNDRMVVTDGEVVASEIIDRRPILMAPRVDPVRQVPGVTVDCPSPDTASAWNETVGVLEIIRIALRMEILQAPRHLACNRA